MNSSGICTELEGAKKMSEVEVAEEAPAEAVDVKAAPAAPAAAKVADWVAALAPEDRDLVELKKYATPGDAVRALRNAQKLIGAPAEEMVRLSPNGMDEESAKRFLKHIGVPASPDEYKIPVPEGGDPEFAKISAGWFHEADLTQAQAKGLTEKFNQYVGEKLAESEQSHAAQLQIDEAALRTEWGNAYQQRVGLAKAAAATFGLNEEKLVLLQNALGPAEMVKFVYGLAAKIGEDKFVSGLTSGQSGALTPGAARARLGEMKSDPEFMTQWKRGDKKALREWSEVHAAMFPEREA